MEADRERFIHAERELHRRALDCARQEDERLELREFASPEDAVAHAHAYIDQIEASERQVLFHAIEETSLWLDCVEDIKKVFFLDAGIRPLVPILHAFRKKHNKPWSNNQFLPIGREIAILSKKQRERAVSEITGVEEGPIYLIDEFSFSGNTLDITATTISNTFGLLPNEIHTHAITDANTANGLFITPRSGSSHGDGLQWEHQDISFRFPVRRTIESDTGDWKSIRVDAYTLPHTTERLLDLANAYLKKSYSTEQRDAYLEERNTQVALDRVFYRSYVDSLRDAILSYDTH